MYSIKSLKVRKEGLASIFIETTDLYFLEEDNTVSVRPELEKIKRNGYLIVFGTHSNKIKTSPITRVIRKSSDFMVVYTDNYVFELRKF